MLKYLLKNVKSSYESDLKRIITSYIISEIKKLSNIGIYSERPYFLKK